MGEVRVKVKLFNAGDEILVRRGLLKSEQIRTYETEALVDTGAVRSVIPAHVREHLGLALIGERVAEFADGRNDVVGFAEPIRFELLQRDTFDDALARVIV